MADEDFECEKCGDEFDSQRGLSIHQSQKHDGGEEESDTEESVDSQKPESETFDFSISKTQGLAIFLIVGLAVGYTAGNLFPMMETGTKAPAPSQGDTQSPDNNQQQEPSIAKIDNEGDPVLGDENAPVTMVIYEDFECPFCARFENGAFPQVEQNYVDTGKVKVVWKDFPLERIHPWATPAAEAMECVYQEGGNEPFWTVKDKIYDNQESLNAGNAQDQIVTWAAQEGVDSSAVRSCLQNSNPGQEVQEDLQEGQSFDITIRDSPFVGGTPSAVIYSEGSETGTPLVGAQPYSRFKEAIDSELGK